MNRITTSLMLAGIIIAVAMTAARAQDDLPADVRRALPAVPKKVTENVSAETDTTADAESVDDQLNKALLRYKNVSAPNRELTERWQAELNERLGRLETLLKSVQVQQSKPPAQEGSATESKSHTVLRPTAPTVVERSDSGTKSSTGSKKSSVAPAVSEGTGLDLEPKGLSKSAAPNHARPTTKSNVTQADELEKLAAACEQLAETLRKAATAMRCK